MSKRPLILSIIVVLIAAATLPLPAHTAAQAPSAEFAPGEILIGWTPDAPEANATLSAAGMQPEAVLRRSASEDVAPVSAALTALTGLATLDVLPQHGVARLGVASGQEQREITRLQGLPWVTYAEPNYIAHAASPAPGAEATQAAAPSAVYPNDPFFGDQWYLRRVDAPAAWDVTLGSAALIVAVVDSGIDLSHPEFAGRLEAGYNFVNGASTPTDDTRDGHGTHVAGLIAAAANNATGIAGLAPNVRLMPVKALDSTGSGKYSDIALAIRWAVDHQAKIINLSLGGASASDTLHNAVIYATELGALVVAAGGNCGSGGGSCSGTNPDFYPAAYYEVLAVGASDHYDNWAGYSGYKSYIGLTAPGGVSYDRIWSTVPGGYGFDYGTSMAAPLVTGAAALVWSVAPTLNAGQVAATLKGSADKAGPFPYANGRNDYFGHGRLNIHRAVRLALPPALSRPTAPQSFVLGQGAGDSRTLNLTLTNPSEQPVFWRASVVEGSSWLTVTTSGGATTFSAPSALTLRAGPSALAPGYYDGIVRVEVLSPPTEPFNIPFLLRVTDLTRRTFLSNVANNYQVMDWINPLNGGTPLGLGDNGARQLLLPFPFRFFGRTYTEIWVSDNGLATFGAQPYTGSAYNAPGCLPSAATPNDTVYVLWQDLNPNLGGQIYAQQPDADRFAITWYHVPRADGGGPQTFQLLLTRDNRLLLQYQTVSGPPRATVGIENYDGTVAQQIACGGAGATLRSGSTFALRAELPW